MRRSSTAFLVAAGLVWSVAVGLGLWAFLSYDETPSAGAAAPAEWPSGSRVARAPDWPTLVLFLHPRCPCSSASMQELADLSTQVEAPVAVRVVVVRPPGVEPGWEGDFALDVAQRLPGADVMVDDGAVEVRRFDAHTSGQVMLYDRRGRLTFSGGITRRRGELGESAGRLRLRALIEGRAIDAHESKVFGCSLLDVD